MNLIYDGHKQLEEVIITSNNKSITIQLTKNEYAYGYEKINDDTFVFIISKEFLDVYKSKKYQPKLKHIIEVENEIITSVGKFSVNKGFYEIIEIVFADHKLGIMVKPRQVSKSNPALDSSVDVTDAFDVLDLIGDAVNGLSDILSGF